MHRLLLAALMFVAVGCGDDSGVSGPLADGVDARLVGKWINTFKTGHTVSDNYMTLAADGTYEFRSRTESANPGTDTVWGPLVTGRWKVEGNTLHYTLGEDARWIPRGQVKMSGRDSLVLTPPGGMAMLWQRTQ